MPCRRIVALLVRSRSSSSPSHLSGGSDRSAATPFGVAAKQHLSRRTSRRFAPGPAFFRASWVHPARRLAHCWTPWSFVVTLPGSTDSWRPFLRRPHSAWIAPRGRRHDAVGNLAYVWWSLAVFVPSVRCPKVANTKPSRRRMKKPSHLAKGDWVNLWRGRTPNEPDRVGLYWFILTFRFTLLRSACWSRKQSLRVGTVTLYSLAAGVSTHFTSWRSTVISFELPCQSSDHLTHHVDDRNENGGYDN